MVTLANTTEQILETRGTTHGDFMENSRISQHIKNIMEVSEGWTRLSPHQREALHMIAHKIARALAGNPDFRDHWDDIAGYAKLVADRCL